MSLEIDPMPDASERLRVTLADLHEQLESGHPVDPELREPLQEVMQDIDALLERSATGEEGHLSSLADRVSRMALEFERSHPTIAGTLNRLTHMLSSMGI